LSPFLNEQNNPDYGSKVEQIGIIVKGEMEQTGNYSERLEQIREALSISGKDFSEQIGIPYRSYMNYKNGRTPPVELLGKVVELFKVNAQWMMTGKGEMFVKQADSTQTVEETEELSEDILDDLPEFDEDSADESLPDLAKERNKESPEEIQMRMMKHLLDLSEENKQLRERVQELELRLRRERRGRIISRNS